MDMGQPGYEGGGGKVEGVPIWLDCTRLPFELHFASGRSDQVGREGPHLKEGMCRGWGELRRCASVCVVLRRWWGEGGGSAHSA